MPFFPLALEIHQISSFVLRGDCIQLSSNESSSPIAFMITIAQPFVQRNLYLYFLLYWAM